MADRIQYRRDTKTNWLKYNPILLEGEVGYETDTHRQKIGDGVKTYSELEYISGVSNITQEMGNSETLAPSQKLLSEQLDSLVKCVVLTQEEYDSMIEKDENTLYFIKKK